VDEAANRSPCGRIDWTDRGAHTVDPQARRAVWFSALCNVGTYFIAGTPVANTVAKTVKADTSRLP
jgi:hypothetical protein